MKRFRVGLRLMLLVVSLFAVCFAWIGAQHELQQARIQTEVDTLQHSREYALVNRNRFTSEAAWQARMDELDAAIADKTKELK